MSEHRALLALSFAPGLAAAARDALVRRARTALALLCDGEAVRACVEGAHELVLEAGLAAPQRVEADGSFATAFGVGGSEWRRGRACDGAALLAALRASGASALSELAPPFAALFRLGPGAPLCAATDPCGLHHVYVCEGEGFAACGSSCAALGALLEAGLDLEALAVYAQLGFYLDADTPLRGVRRLLRREACSLAEGRLQVAPYAEAPPREPRFASFEQAVSEGVACLREVVGAQVDAHAGAGISLSGGLDSRLVLAALPAARRASLAVLTLDTPGRGDRALVERMVPLCGFAPTCVDTRGFPGERAEEIAGGAARRRDWCANPLSTAVFEWAEAALPAAPRLHGQNGEFARGFYYAGQPAAGGVTPARVESLMRWRLLTGERVAPWLLAPAFREPLIAALRERIHAWLAATGLPWLEALDELYLCQRMERWVGVEMSRTSMRRIDLSPFFDPRFLAFARRAAPDWKRDSRLLAAVLEALDPPLAALPLDGRPSPRALARRGPAMRLYAASSFAAKAARKLRQRLGGRAAAPAGAPAVREHLLARAAAAGAKLGRAARSPLFEQTALEGALAPASRLDVASLGFALDVEWLLEFLERVSRESATVARPAALA